MKPEQIVHKTFNNMNLPESMIYSHHNHTEHSRNDHFYNQKNMYTRDQPEKQSMPLHKL